MMRRIISLLLSIALILAVPMTVNAASPSMELSFSQITMGDRNVVVPVVSKEISTFSTDSGRATKQLTFYLPVTEEGFEYNEQFVKKARNFSGETTDTNIDPKMYMGVTTYIRYTISGAVSDNVWVDDFMVLIDNVAITKDKSPDSNYLIGISSPSAYVECSGYDVVGGSTTTGQATNLSLNWGTAGVDTPSNWRPVVRGAYSNGCWAHAIFSCNLVYKVGGGVEEVACRFQHILNK